MFIEHAKSENIYDYLIEPKIKMPVGLQHWLDDMDLSESNIRTGFTFAKKCSKSTFDQVFQYKIMTQILPTNKYLNQYRIIESELCTKCAVRSDTVLHRLWQCQLLVPYRDKIITFLTQQCQIQENISLKAYMFGFSKNQGLNHTLLELKKLIFYTWEPNIQIDALLDLFIDKIRKLIIKEKQCVVSSKLYEQFHTKWENFKIIYDLNGPDLQIF